VLRRDQRDRIGHDDLGGRAERAPAGEGGAHDPPDVTVGLWVVEDGVDDEDPLSLDDEAPESLGDEPESLEGVVVVVVCAVAVCEVLAHARPLSASAAAAVSATAHRRSACMRRRPWSRVRVRCGSGELMAASFGPRAQGRPRGSWGMAET